jgi:hypothetical protein
MVVGFASEIMHLEGGMQAWTGIVMRVQGAEGDKRCT